MTNCNNGNDYKSLEQWLWDAACSIRGAKDAPKYKDYILPLVFAKRLCDVFDDELNRIAENVGGRANAFRLVRRDKKLVRFYIPLEPDDSDEPVSSVVRKLADKIGERLTDHRANGYRTTVPADCPDPGTQTRPGAQTLHRRPAWRNTENH